MSQLFNSGTKPFENNNQAPVKSVGPSKVEYICYCVYYNNKKVTVNNLFITVNPIINEWNDKI